MYFRDVLECVQALYGDPELAPILVFAPEHHYTDADKTDHLFHDMHTGKWWWETQVHDSSSIHDSRKTDYIYV